MAKKAWKETGVVTCSSEDSQRGRFYSEKLTYWINMDDNPEKEE